MSETATVDAHTVYHRIERFFFGVSTPNAFLAGIDMTAFQPELARRLLGVMNPEWENLPPGAEEAHRSLEAFLSPAPAAAPVPAGSSEPPAPLAVIDGSVTHVPGTAAGDAWDSLLGWVTGMQRQMVSETLAAGRDLPTAAATATTSMALCLMELGARCPEQALDLVKMLGGSDNPQSECAEILDGIARGRDWRVRP